MDPLPTAAVLLSRALAERRARVGVVGLGYAGPPRPPGGGRPRGGVVGRGRPGRRRAEAFVAAAFAALGHAVAPAKTEALVRGRSCPGHAPPTRVPPLRAPNRFEPTADAERL